MNSHRMGSIVHFRGVDDGGVEAAGAPLGGLMARFTGTYVNKVDKKGRVSVPAPFRTTLEALAPVVKPVEPKPEGAAAKPVLIVNLKPTPDRRALDGVTEAYMDEVQRRLDAMDLYSPEREALEIREFSETEHLQIDSDGRIILPRQMMELAGITENVAFMGMGSRFQIWEPEALKAHQQARLAASRDMTLARAGANGGAA
ncbi:MAG: MraZ family transcriptional regulator [Inquilinus limosus]|uniref:Transcriptional regulator MraZ n=1 Tax=Inquilinus limosus TaxID=171674 RepID=A0A952FJ03_9PROT|nr:MraZ family transcriptional regulator [Inquilinus limosus]